MSARASTQRRELPAAALLVAPARVLLDHLVGRALKLAGEQAEVHRLHARSYQRESEGALLNDLLRLLEGQSLFAPVRVVLLYDGAAVLKEKPLKRWLERPPAHTHLLLAHQKRSARDRTPAIPKGLPVKVWEETGPGHASQLGPWMKEYAAQHGSSLDAKAAALLQELVGTSVDALASELDKLVLYCSEGKIEARHVEELVGHSAGRDFDRLLDALKKRSRKGALGLQQAMAEEGLLVFGRSRVYGERATAGTLVPLLLSRIRRIAAVGAADPALRAEVQKALSISPGYAGVLGRDARDLSGPTLKRLLSGALAAEVAQKRIGGIPDDELLTLLLLEWCDR